MYKQDGFSLVEAVVTMAIAAIVLSIGVPSFQSYIQNNRQTIAVNELATALQLARNSAITRRVPVTLCKSANGFNCVTDGNGSDWTQGWMIFTNPNNISGTAGLDANVGEVLLRMHGALDGDASFSGNQRVDDRVTFSAQGLARNNNGTILHCDSRGDTKAKALIISIGGQVRQATDGSGNGIVDIDGTGATDVAC